MEEGRVALKPYYEQDGITIYHGDCREVLPTLGRFDLLLTDPPYGIGDKWADGPMVGRNGSSRLWGRGEQWDRTTAPLWLIEQAVDHAELAIIWGGNYYSLPPSRAWLTWDKVQSFSGSDFELAWTTLEIPGRAFRMSRIDAYQNVSKEAKSHPTQKPLALILWCMDLAGEFTSVLDPFMGSGTTLVAAKRLGKSAAGIELDEKYCEIAAKRLSQGALPMEFSA